MYSCTALVLMREDECFDNGIASDGSCSGGFLLCFSD